MAGFHTAIADARAWLATLKPEQLVSREDTPLTHKLGTGMEPTLPGGQWITSFGLTNISFHTSMVYAILRAKGVTIGKSDLFPLGL